MGTWIFPQQSWMQKARGTADTQTELALGQRGVQGAVTPRGWTRLNEGTTKPGGSLCTQLLLVNELVRGKVREAGCSARARSALSPAPRAGPAGATAGRFPRFRAFPQVRGWN